MAVLASDRIEFAPPDIGSDEIDAVVATLRSGWLSTGPRVQQFERAFAEYVGAPHAIAVSSGTAALHLSLLARGIGAGDEVVTTPLTFCATANVIVHTGATPVFADVDATTMNLAPESAAAAMTSRTRALLPVDFAGRPVDAAGFRALAARTGAALIEDAAHCVEGWSQRFKVGAAADLTCFSFYATKNLTTGEGGMVTTGSETMAECIRMMSLHGLSHGAWARYRHGASRTYEVLYPGFKYNLTDIGAALGICQLARLDDRLRRRERIWAAYDAGLAGLPIIRPAPPTAGDRHARHLYTIVVDEQRSGCSRDALRARLDERGVATSVHFRALHLQPYYVERFGFRRGMFPVAESLSDRILSLPLSPSMSDEQVGRVVEAVTSCLQ